MNRHRNGATLLSILCMGLGQFYNRQIGKGLLYILIYGCGLYYLIQYLPHGLWGIYTLGEEPMRMVKVGNVYQRTGDHSIYLLILGLAVIILFILLLTLYVLNIRDAWYNGSLRDRKELVNNFAESVRNVFDKKFYVVLLAIPAITVAFLTILPIIFTILLAFTNYSSPNHLPPAKLVDWTGLSTFIHLLQLKSWAHTFVGVLGWTIIWAVTATVTTYFGGLIVALLVQMRGIKFKGMWRTLFIIPYAIPQLISLLVMRNLFNGAFGPINQYLSYFGVDQLPWLSDPVWAKLTVILVNMWVGIPVSMILIMGILTTIPRDLYEAAEVDGATRTQQFRLITLPRVLFSTAPILIAQFAGNINNFNVIFLLTNGNPVNGDYQFAGSTDLLVTWLYKLTLNQGQYNMAAVIGIIIFVIIASISIFSYRRTKSFREEDLLR